MSDHWKTLARLLGAPGAADPPKPKPKAPPTASKPAESKPAETKPAETKPAETKPAETKPAVSASRTPAGEGPTSEIPTAEALPGSLPGFGPAAASEPADEDVDDLFSGFGKPRAAVQRSESRAPESREAAPAAPETSRRADSDRSETRTPAEQMFSEPIRSEGPSSWDELVDRLGIPAAPSPQPRLSDSEPLEAPAQRESAERGRPQRSTPSRPKSAGGGFGGGLGIEEEPESAAAEVPRGAQQGRESRQEPVSQEPVSKGASELEASTPVERDPLEELGEFGWGPPRRGRAASARRGGAEEREERPSRSGEEASREEAARQPRGRGEGRRGERSREERSPREERSFREERPARGIEEPVAEKFAAEDTGRGEAGRSEETSGRPARRGRRRGQRQRMSEEKVGWDEDRTASLSREREPVGFEDEDETPVRFVEDEVEEEFGVLPEIDEDAVTARRSEETEGEGSESQPRRRRRRGRRRRGGSAETGAEPTAREGREGGPTREDRGAAAEGERAGVRATSGAAGRAIDSEFDDDHEDDDEAVALRRSRRGRRRRTPVAEADLGAGEDTPRSSNYGAEADGGEEDEVVLQNTQRNIPTWADTVALLVNPNLESRKRDPQRGGGGGGGRNRGRRRD